MLWYIHESFLNLLPSDFYQRYLSLFPPSALFIFIFFFFFLSKSKFYLKVLRKGMERIKERNLHLRDCKLLQRQRMPALKCESTYLKRKDAGDIYLGSMYPGKMSPYLFS